MAKKPIPIRASDRNPRTRWRVSLTEDASEKQRNFPGSAFSPLLFGKFFDPADAFPIWDFDVDSLLAGSKVRKVDWGETDDAFFFKTELPGSSKYDVEICIESGKILEISRQLRESTDTKDWRTDMWWEYGQVRRLELPPNADWRKAEAYVENDIYLEIRIPKTSSGCSVPEANVAEN